MLVRLRHGDGPRWWVRRGDALAGLETDLAGLLSVPLEQARRAYERATGPVEPTDAHGLLAPVDEQEVWAAGVTYLRSREGRREESGDGSLYDRVYASERPELFFKATPGRVVGPDGAVGIRGDSGWDVPEPELGLVVNASGELFGYTVGNDMSSRSIEGDNPLYLPQAKIDDRSCARGPGVVPVWEAGPGPFGVALRVERDGREAYAGTTSTASMARSFPDLIGWLRRALTFPAGVVLLTGTGIVPGPDFTLRPGDTVTIDIEGIGTLRNPVRAVGAGS